jgi:hypothetical protein
MKLSAIFNLNTVANTSGAQSAMSALTDKVKATANSLGVAAANAAKLARSGIASRFGGGGGGRGGGGGGGGFDPGEHRQSRGVMGSRAAAGRDFAGMASAGNTSGFVAAYATLASNIFALTAAFQALSNAAKTEELLNGLKLVGAQAGTTLTVVAKNLQEVTGFGITAADAMRTVAQASASGITNDEITQLGAVARGASVALGRDLSDSMDRLIRGVAKLEPELIDELGIMTRLDDAMRAYADANGKTVQSLTRTEKSQAFLNAVLDEGKKKFGDVADQLDINPYNKLAASVRDLGTSILTIVNKVLAPVAEILAANPAAALIPALSILTMAFSKILPNAININKEITKELAYRGQVTTAIKEQIVQEEILQANGDADAAKRLRNLKIELDFLQKREQVLRATNVAVERTKLEGGGIVTAFSAVKEAKDTLGEDKKLGLANTFRIVGSSVLGIVSNMMLWISVATALIGIAKGIYDYFDRANKPIKDAKKELGEMADRAKETRKQVQLMAETNPAKGFDASVNSVTELYNKLISINSIVAQIEKKKVLEDLGKTIVGDNNTKAEEGVLAPVETLQRQLNRRVGKETADALLEIASASDVLGEGFKNSAIEALKLVKTKEDAVEWGKKFGKPIADITGRLEVVQQSFAQTNTELQKLFNPKDYDTTLSPLVDAFSQAEKEIKQIQKQIAETPNADTFMSKLAFGSTLQSFGITNLQQIEKLTDKDLKIQLLIDAEKEKNPIIKALMTGFAKIEIATAFIQQDPFAALKERQEAERALEIEKEKFNLTVQTAQINADMNKKRLDAEMALLKMQKDRRLAGFSLSKEFDIGQEILDKTKSLNLDKAANTEKIKQLDNELKLKRGLLNILETSKQDEATIKARTEEELKYNEEANLIAKKKAQIRQEETLAQEYLVSLSKELVDRQNDENYQKLQTIQNAQKLLDLEKERLSVIERGRELRLSLKEAQLNLENARLGRTMSQEDTFKLEQERFDIAIKNLEAQETFAKEEHKYKMQLLDLEQTIKDAEMQLLIKNLRDAGLTVAADTLETERQGLKSIFENMRNMMQGTRFLEGLTTLGELSLLKIQKQTSAAERQNQINAPATAMQQNRLMNGAGILSSLGGFSEQFNTALQDKSTVSGKSIVEILSDPKTVQQINESAIALKQVALEGELLNTVGQGFNDLFTKGFEMMITGAEGATEAFRNMAKDMLMQIGAVIAKMLVLKLIETSLNFVAPGAGTAAVSLMGMKNGGIMPMANGGIMERAQGIQGIISKPTYLVGEGKHNEAVVPLPNGREIPVQLQGNSSNSNNVQVNVNMSGNGGQATTETQGQDMNQLGQAIAVAVQRELINQKRPGGILSRYGAA